MDTQTPALNPERTTKRRISKKVRAALIMRVKELKSWKECAEAAGLSEAGIHKARKQIHVQQALEEIKGEYVQEVEALKAPYKARAFEVGHDLMENSKSDAVRARMVEFFAGESKGMQVNVGVQVNNQPAAQGYEYAHPHQEVVTIRRAQDTQSGADTSQDPVIIDHQE